MKIINKKEIGAIVLTVLVLGIVFGFDDNTKSFVFSYWIKNFLFVLGLVVISLLINILVVKYFAYRHDCISEYKIWTVKRFGFKRWERFDGTGTGKALKGIPFGIMLAFLFTLLTNGLLYFTAIGEHDITIKKTARTGRKHLELGGYEEAIIQLAGPLTHIALMILGMALGLAFKANIGMFVTINFFMALFLMLPFSSLAGAKIFFGSRNLYVFGLLVIILAYILKGAGFIGAIVLTLLLAALLTGAYYFLWEV